MKQHLLLVLVALGLVVVTPTVAQAEVHFGFSLGFPAYYDAFPDLCHRGYYPYYSGYSHYKPYWFKRSYWHRRPHSHCSHYHR
jgi:hypothetical protein